VGVIGTGSSGIQSIPLIAEQASHLHVFQRTPNFSIPAHNGNLSAQTLEDWNANRAAYRDSARNSVFGVRTIDPSEKSALETPHEERQRVYEQRWQRGGFAVAGSFADLIINKDANDTAADFVRAKIREIVQDTAIAEKLMPRDFPIATKRLCVDTNYYATFNRDNVTLVDLRTTPILEITPAGIRTTDREYAVDRIVFATGFDAMTGALSNIDIRGRAGLSLKEKWTAGPRTYLGLTVAGFPNLFTITGPGSPSVLSNMVLSIEQHADWIADCLAYLRNHHIATIEASLDAENNWVDHVNEVANFTLYPLANSWYVGANIPGKPRVFMPYIGGLAVYRQKCAEVASNDYAGFALGSPAVGYTVRP
jgi:cation diffusion facilitator CzcD-associated flavoprotein CzcO